MEEKKYKVKYDKKINKKDRVKRKIINIKWVIFITLAAFIITLLLTVSSDFIIKRINVVFGTLIIIFFILLGVLTDIIGIAVTSADEKPFHSMATKRIRGSRLAIKMIRHASKVSAFCNDVIGDICNIMSGSAAVVVANSLSTKYNFNPVITVLLITAVVAASIVGGKAAGKSLAINKSELIVYEFAKLCSIFVK